MRHLFLINPVAGKGIRPTETAEEIQQLMKNRPDTYDIRVTEYKGHAEELTHRAAEESGEPLRVYAFGGDGSLNEVVNGGAGYDHVAVTVLPRGSGNDFLKLFTTGGEERSGMGFTIMESFMDVLRIKSAPNKGTTVVMRKRISQRTKR